MSVNIILCCGMNRHWDGFPWALEFVVEDEPNNVFGRTSYVHVLFLFCAGRHLLSSLQQRLSLSSLQLRLSTNQERIRLVLLCFAYNATCTTYARTLGLTNVHVHVCVHVHSAGFHTGVFIWGGGETPVICGRRDGDVLLPHKTRNGTITQSNLVLSKCLVVHTCTIDMVVLLHL